MKIKAIQASAFGCFNEWESGSIDSNLVLICGPNEAGKSTFFHLIKTLFYGWHPVTDNPFLPWDGKPASLSAVIAKDSGEEIIVQRKLHRRAQGQVIKGSTGSDISNKALGFLAFLPQELFSEVYFLTLDQLRFPQAGVWQNIQDQLLGGQFASFIKPISGVIAALEEEANGLWRPDRRGKPLNKIIDEQIRHLLQQRKIAYENEQNLRNIEEQLFLLRAEREKLREERIQLLAELNRAERLLPVKKKLERINELLEMVGDIQLYRDIPVEPEKSLAEIDAELSAVAAALSKMEEKREQLSSQKNAFGDRERIYLAQTEEISEITKAYAQIASDQQAYSSGKIGLKQITQRLTDCAATFLLGGWQAKLERIIKGIDEVELRSEILAFKQFKTQYHSKCSKLEGLKARTSFGITGNLRILSLFSTALILLGLGGIFWFGNSPLGFAAALFMLLGVGMGLYLFIVKGRKFAAAEVNAIEKEVAKLERECLESAARIKKALKGLPVAEQRLQEPDESLLVDLKNMKIYLAEKDVLEDKLVQLEARLQDYHDKVRGLLTTLELSPSEDLLKDIRHLENGLALARESQITAKHAANGLAEVEAELAELQSKQKKLETEKKQLLNSLQSLPGVELEDKINNLLQRRNLWQQALTLRKDLESSYPDLKALEKEIADAEKSGTTWFFSDQDYARKKIEFAESEIAMAEINEKIARLETELTHLTKQERVADLEGALEQLQSEKKLVAKKRDRLVLLQNLIKEADRRFREEHQPDVLQRAGYYLERITNGRYDRLFVKEDGSGLMVRGNYIDRFLEVASPLSRGTLEQIYLALRLALAEHLDSGKEIVPLFLDEILVNWDGVRLQNGLEILAKLAKERQIFLFTCHDWLVPRIEKIAEVKIIHLY